MKLKLPILQLTLQKVKPIWIGAAAIVVAVLVLVFWHVHTPHKATPASNKAGVVTQSATPDETPITKATPSYSWQGAATEPKYLNMPSIGAQGYIQRMGVNQSKQIASPTNISFAGWYVNSVLPGSPGLSIIDGHINGRTSADGIFKNLTKLHLGDAFTVERGDGKVIQYTVIANQILNENDALSTLFSQDPHTPNQLNLISCTGDYLAQSHAYNKRVIVSARQQL